MTSKRATINREAAARRLRQFEGSVQLLASRLGAPRVNIGGTPISTFRSRYSSVLGRVRAGSIEVITQNGEPFVILGMDQFIAMYARIGQPKTAAEILAGLPAAPLSPHVPRHTSIPLSRSHHRVSTEE